MISLKLTPQKAGSFQSVLQHSTEVYQSTLSISESKSPISKPTLQTQPFVRGVANTLQQSVSTKWTSLQRMKRNSAVETNLSPTLNNRTPVDSIRARLVVLVDKKSAQRARVDPESEVELLACDFNLDGLRDAYKSLVKSLANDKMVPRIAEIGESGWYDLVSGQWSKYLFTLKNFESVLDH